MKLITPIFTFLMLLLTGCIHEYPYPEKGGGKHEPGNDPTTMTATLEVTFDLNWEELLYNFEITPKSRARTERPHRFVIEVIENGKTLCHDYEYLSDDEFKRGSLTHKISVPLGNKVHTVAVWHDSQDEDGEYSFMADDLSGVNLNRFSTTDAERMTCAYASEILDLTGVDTKNETEIKKSIELHHAGARFELIATDIQNFISRNKESLNQGDTFTAHVTLVSGAGESMNVLTERIKYPSQISLSGWMRLPFDEYDSLKIAEGFVFCEEEAEISAVLRVENSSLLPVSETNQFTFPVKRGYVTKIYGDFLSNGIEGLFSINNIWEEEIVIEI